jgi:hypothetical protein
VASVALFASVHRTPVDAKGPGDTHDIGFLDVASDPPAKIAIDGSDTGKITPQSHLALPIGHHTLTLVEVDGKRQRTLGFTIDRGETTKLTLHMAS